MLTVIMLLAGLWFVWAFVLKPIFDLSGTTRTTRSNEMPAPIQRPEMSYSFTMNAQIRMAKKLPEDTIESLGREVAEDFVARLHSHEWKATHNDPRFGDPVKPDVVVVNTDIGTEEFA